MAILFGIDVKTIGKHINNVFNDGELETEGVAANIATTAKDGKSCQVDQYNFDYQKGTRECIVTRHNTIFLLICRR